MRLPQVWHSESVLNHNRFPLKPQPGLMQYAADLGDAADGDLEPLSKPVGRVVSGQMQSTETGARLARSLP